MHKDSMDNELKEDFYLDKGSGRIFYFTGKYNCCGNAVCQDSSERESPLTRFLTEDFVKIGNPSMYLSQMKSDVSWMERKLSALEEFAQSKPK